MCPVTTLGSQPIKRLTTDYCVVMKMLTKNVPPQNYWTSSNPIRKPPLPVSLLFFTQTEVITSVGLWKQNHVSTCKNPGDKIFIHEPDIILKQQSKTTVNVFRRISIPPEH